MISDDSQSPVNITEESTSSQINEENSISHLTEEQSQETIKTLQDQLARSQADYANLVRRSREELSQIGQWTEDKTILKFLPILDNLERSLEHIPAEFIHNSWVEGTRSIVRSMQKILHDFGVTSMDTIGKEVDPDLHDVISQIPAQSITIQTEIEKGYIRGNKAIRHAKVIVGDGTTTDITP